MQLGAMDQIMKKVSLERLLVMILLVPKVRSRRSDTYASCGKRRVLSAHDMLGDRFFYELLTDLRETFAVTMRNKVGNATGMFVVSGDWIEVIG